MVFTNINNQATEIIQISLRILKKSETTEIDELTERKKIFARKTEINYITKITRITRTSETIEPTFMITETIEPVTKITETIGATILY